MTSSSSSDQVKVLAAVSERVLAISRSAADPFDPAFLDLAERLCNQAGVRFQRITPELGSDLELGERDHRSWDLEVCRASGNAENRLQVVREGIALDDVEVTRPVVRLTLVGVPSWDLPAGPPEVIAEFERLDRLYEQLLVERTLAGSRGGFEAILKQLSVTQRRLFEGLHAGTAGPEWLNLVNHHIWRWLDSQQDLEVDCFSPAQARDQLKRDHLLVIPDQDSVSVLGFVVRQRDESDALSDPVVIPAIGHPGPPRSLRAAVAAFEAEALPDPARAFLRAVRDLGEDVWPEPLLEALIRAYIVAERHDEVDADLRRHLRRQLIAAGVAITAEGGPCPERLARCGTATYRWNTAAPGTVLSMRRAGISCGEEIFQTFEGVLSTGPAPYLWAWLDDQDGVAAPPPPQGSGPDSRGYLDGLYRLFLERQSDFPVGQRLRLLRRIHDGRCEPSSLPCRPLPDHRPPWSKLSLRQRLEALGPDPDFDLNVTPRSGLLRPRLDLVPGLACGDLRAEPILDVQLPLDSSLIEMLRRLESEQQPVLERIRQLILEIRARNAAARHLPSLLAADRAPYREPLCDAFRRLSHALRQGAGADEWPGVDLVNGLLDSCVEESPWLRLRPIRLPPSVPGDERLDDGRYDLDLEYSALHAPRQLIRGMHGLEVDGEPAVPALAVFSLGKLPAEFDEPVLSDRLAEFLANLATASEEIGNRLSDAAGWLAALRAEGPPGRRRFIALERLAELYDDALELIDGIVPGGDAGVSILVTEGSQGQLPPREQESFLPGLRWRDRTILPAAGTVYRRAPEIELRLRRELAGSEALERVEEIFHQGLGRLDSVPPEIRLELLRLYTDNTRQPDEAVARLLLEGTPYRRVTTGDLLSDEIIGGCRRPAFTFESSAAGTVLAVEPFTVVEEATGTVVAQAPLTLSCGPRDRLASRLLDLARDPSGSQDKLRHFQARIDGLEPSIDYIARVAALLLELVDLLYNPECLLHGDRSSLLEVFKQAADSGLWSVEPTTEVRTLYIASSESRVNAAARPGVHLRTLSDERVLPAIELVHHPLPPSLTSLWQELGRPVLQNDHLDGVKEQVARAVLAHLDALDAEQLTGWAAGFDAERAADLRSYCGLELFLDPTSAATEAEERPWSLYHDSKPPGAVVVHRAGYRLGAGEARPLVWNRSLGPLPSDFAGYRAARILLDFLAWFLQEFGDTMINRLDDDQTRADFRNLLAKWHQEIIVDMVEVKPTTLVARAHRHIYQTLERWSLIPEDLRDRALSHLQVSYRDIETAYRGAVNGSTRSRVALFTCEPEHPIARADRRRFETVEGEPPHWGTRVDPVASGLEIQLNGRFGAVKCIVRKTITRPTA